MSIRKAAEYLDVTEDCLRKWEKGGKITPLKTAGGHRRYKREDLERLVGIESDEEVKKYVVQLTQEFRQTSRSRRGTWTDSRRDCRNTVPRTTLW